MAGQCTEDALWLAVDQQAVLEPGWGTLPLMSLLPVMEPKEQLLRSLRGKDGSSVLALAKCVGQSKMAVPEDEQHFQHHPLAVTELHGLQTLAEYHPNGPFSVVMP